MCLDYTYTAHPALTTNKGQELGDEDDNQYFKAELNGELVCYYVDKTKGIEFRLTIETDQLNLDSLYQPPDMPE